MFCTLPSLAHAQQLSRAPFIVISLKLIKIQRLLLTAKNAEVLWSSSYLNNRVLLSKALSCDRLACSRHSDSGARAKTKASERAGKNEGRLGERTRERL